MFFFAELSSSRELVDRDVTIRVGSGEVVSAKAVGVARLNFRNKFLVLNNVFFIPGFRRNLISVSMFHEQLFSISFINNEIVISRNGLDICHAKPENGLYVLRPIERSLNNSELFKVEHPKSNKCQKVSHSDNTYPKGTRGGLFYSPSDKKVLVWTNDTFLEDDYMTNFKPRSKVLLEELRFNQIRKSPSTTNERQS